MTHRSLLDAFVMLALACCAMFAMPVAAFDLEGHRGTRGLAPENTLAAFRRALQIGVSTLETDMAVNKDGVIVISHDPFLNPDPASKYAQQFPQQQPVDGERFPQLTELFDLLKSSSKPVRLNIETKITPTSGAETPDPAQFAALVVAAVQAANMSERVTVQSFDWRTLVEVKRLAPDIETSCLTIQTTTIDTVQAVDGGASPWHAGLALRAYGGSLPALVKAAGCGVWSMFWRNLSPQDLAAAHALGLEVLPWTVNDRADMSRLIDLGVDGIITDFPDRLRSVMAEKKLPLP